MGEGGYSVVKRGISNIDKRVVAVKIVNRTGLSEEDEQSLRGEVAILQRLHHKNIVHAKDFFEEPKHFYVILEYVDGGELFDRIVQKTVYSENDARDLVVVLLRAIKYCHDLNIVHRDLKPENLLLTSKSEDADVKIADFGFAVEAEGCTLTDACGTPAYIAPEILLAKPYGKPCDMWSFGVILFVLLGGYPPFHDENQSKLLKKIKKCEYEFHEDYWGQVSDEAKDLIKKLLNPDMFERVTVDQALAHPWCTQSADQLAARSLDNNLKQLKTYQKTRKLKKAVRAVIAVNRMKHLLEGIRGAASEIDTEEGQSIDATGKDSDSCRAETTVQDNTNNSPTTPSAENDVIMYNNPIT